MQKWYPSVHCTYYIDFEKQNSDEYKFTVYINKKTDGSPEYIFENSDEIRHIINKAKKYIEKIHSQYLDSGIQM